MNKNAGVILGGVALIILIVFFLFDSSKRDMIIGKWYSTDLDGVLEFYENNDVTAPSFEGAIWTLSDDEEIIEIHFISDKLRESMLLELVSVSEEELCFIQRGWDEIYGDSDNIITDVTDQERTECLSRVSD